MKRSSWQFRNTPNLLNLMNLEPSYGSLKLNCSLKNNFDWTNQFKIVCKTWIISKHSFFQREKSQLKIYQIEGCFGIVKISSWRWSQRFFKLIHHRMSNTLKTFLISLIIAPTVDSPRQLIARELCSDCSPVSPETLSARARPPVGPRPGAGLPSSVCRQLLLGTKPVLCTVHCTLCCTPAHGLHVSTPTPPERDWDRAADAILWPTQTLLLGIVQISGDRWFITQMPNQTYQE